MYRHSIVRPSVKVKERESSRIASLLIRSLPCRIFRDSWKLTIVGRFFSRKDLSTPIQKVSISSNRTVELPNRIPSSCTARRFRACFFWQKTEKLPKINASTTTPPNNVTWTIKSLGTPTNFAANPAIRNPPGRSSIRRGVTHHGIGRPPSTFPNGNGFQELMTAPRFVSNAAS